MPYHWPEDTKFDQLTLEVEGKSCSECGRTTTVCDHQHRRIHTLIGPLRMTMKLTYEIRLSDDAIEKYIISYEAMPAARQ